jgi:hypothetical protein
MYLEIQNNQKFEIEIIEVPKNVSYFLLPELSGLFVREICVDVSKLSSNDSGVVNFLIKETFY